MERKLIVDSGVDLNESLLKSKFVSRVAYTLDLSGKIFIDDESLDVENYINEMEKCQKGPKSGAPSPENFYKICKNCDVNFIVTMSSLLSGSFNSAVAARNMVFEECKDKIIHIFDSKSASAGETLVALKIKELLEQDVDNEDIISIVTEFINNMKTLFILECYNNLAKNGRMNPYIAKIANLLSITPIAQAKNGEIELMEKVRGYKKAFNRLIALICEDNVDFTKKTLSITHVKAEEKANKFKDEILKKVNFKEIIIQEASGLCSNYAERGGIVVAY